MNIEFRTVIITVDGVDKEINVAQEKDEELLIRNGEYINKEAQRIDEQIYCYVDEAAWKMSDEELGKYVTENF